MASRKQGSSPSRGVAGGLSGHSAYLTVAEQTLLKRTRLGVWFKYMKTTGRRRWPEAEQRLLAVRRLRADAKRYAQEIIQGRWPELEKQLLAEPSDKVTLEYVLDVMQERWPALESQLLTTSFPKGCVQYAAKVIRGRWPELEVLFLSQCATVATQTLYEYAWKVVKGRLPEELHNLMIMRGMAEGGSNAFSVYTTAKKYQ